MPNFISVKQINELELSGFVAQQIVSTVPTGLDYTSLTGYLKSGEYYIDPINSSVGGTTFKKDDVAVFNSYGQLDYGVSPIPDFNRDVDKRIWGKSGTTGNKIWFTLPTHNPTPTYTRNTGCFMYGVDTTPFLVYNFSGISGSRRASLISPRHLIYANHFPILTGASVRFVDNSGNIETRQVTSSSQVFYSGTGADIRIALLDSGVSSNISFCKVLPKNIDTYINLTGLPLIILDQDGYFGVSEYLRQENDGFGIRMVQSILPYRKDFYEQIIGGDSSSPAFLLAGNEPVVVSHFVGAVDGPNYVKYYDSINTTMSQLGGGYQLTPLSLNYFPISYNSLKDLPTGNNAVVNTGDFDLRYYPKTGNPSGFITSGQTGNFASKNDLFLTGKNLLNIINSGNFNIIKASVNLESGKSLQFINYPVIIPTGYDPVISLSNLSGQPILNYQISGRGTTTGFWLTTSASVPSNNYYVNYQILSGSGIPTNFQLYNSYVNNYYVSVINSGGFSGFKTGIIISSGLDKITVNYSLVSPPYIMTNIQIPKGFNTAYTTFISGDITTGSATIGFSSPINNTGYKLMVWGSV